MLVASVVWRSGGVLHADPHLPACVGVAPLGLVLGLVFNHSPGSIQARWETLSVKQDSCLWWRVRVADTAPNAPKATPAVMLMEGETVQSLLSVQKNTPVWASLAHNVLDFPLVHLVLYF